jgi:hypothetical protein
MLMPLLCHTLEMKSETNSLTPLASSEPHMWTSVQTACTISWSPCQYLSSKWPAALPLLWKVSSISNFLCNAWRLKKSRIQKIKITNHGNFYSVVHLILII